MMNKKMEINSPDKEKILLMIHAIGVKAFPRNKERIIPVIVRQHPPMIYSLFLVRSVCFTRKLSMSSSLCKNLEPYWYNMAPFFLFVYRFGILNIKHLLYIFNRVTVKYYSIRPRTKYLLQEVLLEVITDNVYTFQHSRIKKTVDFFNSDNIAAE